MIFGSYPYHGAQGLKDMAGVPTVDGCEILHQLIDGMMVPVK